MPLLIDTFPVGLLQCNCSVLADDRSREAVVIDPGDEAAAIIAALVRRDLKVVGILHTHAHIDHLGATAALVEKTGAPTYLHPEDEFLHRLLPQQAQLVGLPLPAMTSMDRALSDQQAIRFGEFSLGVMHTPGHSPGSVCLLVDGQELCFTGDTLFAGGVGRTDLWGGDFDALCRSISDRLYTLDGATKVIPGHGPSSTIDYERRTNPFVRQR
jgi:hydroxyacylglutathione hydrolase